MEVEGLLDVTTEQDASAPVCWLFNDLVSEAYVELVRNQQNTQALEKGHRQQAMSLQADRLRLLGDNTSLRLENSELADQVTKLRDEVVYLRRCLRDQQEPPAKHPCIDVVDLSE